MRLQVIERQFLHLDVAPLRQLHSRGRLADEALIGQVLTGERDTGDTVVALEIILDLRTRPRFADIAKIFDYRRKERRRALLDVRIDGPQCRLDLGARLFLVEQVGVDGSKESGIESQRLGNHFAIGEHTTADDLDLRQWRRGVQNPESSVLQVATRQEPFVSLVDRAQCPRSRLQQLNLSIALTNLLETGKKLGDALVVRVKKAPLGEKGVYEGVPDRALHHAPKLRASGQHGVDVDTIGVERQSTLFHLPVVDRDEHQIDVGLRPHRVVRQTAAENRRQDGAILLDLLDQPIEGGGKLLLDR